MDQFLIFLNSGDDGYFPTKKKTTGSKANDSLGRCNSVGLVENERKRLGRGDGFLLKGRGSCVLIIGIRIE